MSVTFHVTGVRSDPDDPTDPSVNVSNATAQDLLGALGRTGPGWLHVELWGAHDPADLAARCRRLIWAQGVLDTGRPGATLGARVILGSRPAGRLAEYAARLLPLCSLASRLGRSVSWD